MIKRLQAIAKVQQPVETVLAAKGAQQGSSQAALCKAANSKQTVPAANKCTCLQQWRRIIARLHFPGKTLIAISQG